MLYESFSFSDKILAYKSRTFLQKNFNIFLNSSHQRFIKNVIDMNQHVQCPNYRLQVLGFKNFGQILPNIFPIPVYFLIYLYTVY